MDPLTIQHRKAVGMGGTSHRPEVHEIVTACALCNEEFERSGQDEALARGWKVKFEGTDHRVPVYYAWKRAWAVLLLDGGIKWIDEAAAERLMVEVYGKEFWLTLTARLSSRGSRRT